MTTGILNPDRWVDEHGDMLFRYAMQRTGNEETARDLVQDSLLAALKSAENFQGQSTERTWLVSILKNKIADHYRAKNSQKARMFQEVDMQFFSEEGHWLEERSPADWSSDAFQQMEQKDFARTLTGCLEWMGGKYEQVVRLKFLEGEKSEDICNALDITPSNYWVLIHRAKLRLRECLENHWWNAVKKNA